MTGCKTSPRRDATVFYMLNQKMHLSRASMASLHQTSISFQIGRSGGYPYLRLNAGCVVFL